MSRPRQVSGPLENINLKLEKSQGDDLKRVIASTKTILDAIGSMPGKGDGND